MKKTLLLLAALALTTTGTAFAQTATPAPSTTAPNAQPRIATKTKVKAPKTPKTPEQKADRHAGKMAKELGLNADQEARVEKLMLARQQENAAFKAKYGEDKKAGRPDKKAAYDRYQAQLKEILTAEQYTKFSQMKEDHKAHSKMQGPGVGKMKVKSKA